MDENLVPLQGLPPQMAQSAMDHGLFGMVQSSGPVVFLVLIILIALSVWSWTIMFMKFMQYRKARAQSIEFSTLFWESRNFARVEDTAVCLDGSPLAQVFRTGFRELSQSRGAPGVQTKVGTDLETVERSMRRAESGEVVKLESGLTFLATVASAAPFIGLFGTVWGIMNAFHGLSSAKSTSIQAVAPGISEALVATAIGLAAAIPAAVAYNYCAVAVRQFRENMSRFTLEFLNLARHQ